MCWHPLNCSSIMLPLSLAKSQVGRKKTKSVCHKDYPKICLIGKQVYRSSDLILHLIFANGTPLQCFSSESHGGLLKLSNVQPHYIFLFLNTVSFQEGSLHRKHFLWLRKGETNFFTVNYGSDVLDLAELTYWKNLPLCRRLFN